MDHNFGDIRFATDEVRRRQNEKLAKTDTEVFEWDSGPPKFPAFEPKSLLHP